MKTFFALGFVNKEGGENCALGLKNSRVSLAGLKVKQLQKIC